MWRLPIITRSEASSVAFIIGKIALLFGVAVLIGLVLTALPFILGAIVVFVVLVLVATLVVIELRRFWGRLPR
jgi:hypothetical protein